MGIKRVSIRLNEDLHTALKYIALENNTSLQDMFVKAIEEKYTERLSEHKQNNNKYN